MRRKKPRGTKRVSYQLIDRESTTGRTIYPQLRDLVHEHHEELRDARIALAWCTSWKPDVDGRVVLGKCKKASDLDRELAAFDFIILLRKSFWEDLAVKNEQRLALLDHELHHAAVRCDDRTGDPVLDERGRKVYRLRRHDIEEFTGVVERYGTYKRDLELFYAALRRGAASGFQPCAECKGTPGFVSADGGKSYARCECWNAWQTRLEGETAQRRAS